MNAHAITAPRYVLVVTLAVATMIATGCGTSSDPSTSSPDRSRTVASSDPCEPVPISRTIRPSSTIVRQGEATPVEIGKTTASLKILQAASPKTIRLRFDEKRKFAPPPGSILVAVTYRVKNGGPGQLKPSEDLNSRLFLRVSDELYPYAANLPCGAPVTASWAVARQGSNPAFTTPVGQSATTAAVFIVPTPKQAEALELFISDQAVVNLDVKQ